MNTSQSICFAVYSDSIAKKVDYTDDIFWVYNSFVTVAGTLDNPDTALELMKEEVDKRVLQSESRVESLGLDDDPVDAISGWCAMKVLRHYIDRAQNLRSVARQDGTVFRCDRSPNSYSSDDTIVMVLSDGSEVDVTSECRCGVLSDIVQNAEWIIPFREGIDAMRVKFSPMPSDRTYDQTSRFGSKGDYRVTSRISGTGRLATTMYSVLAAHGKRVVAIYERKKGDEDGFHDIIAVLTPANDLGRFILTRAYNLLNGEYAEPQYNLTGEQIKNRIRGMERIVYSPQFDPDGMIGVL